MAQYHVNSHGGRTDTAAETRPLLSPSPTERPESPATTTTTHRTRCSWPWIYVVLLCIALAIVSDIGESLYTAPRIRLFESVACTRYYLQNDPSLVNPDGSVPEHLCKIDQVQSKVASVLGWQLFFDSIPAILLPIPYGYLADSLGRKWFLVLALTGYGLSWASTLFFIGVMHVSLNYVWLSSLFFLVGGGPAVGSALLTTIVADVVPPESRSTVFFYRFCTDQVADLIVPPITSILMQRSIWSPLVFAVACQGLSFMIALNLPETLPIPDSDICEDAANNQQDTNEQTTSNGKSEKLIQQLKKSFGFVARDGVVLALVFTFLISKVGRQVNNVLFQYASKKYGWTISQANLLLSLRAGVNIALFTVILPAITAYALSRAGSGSKDLWVGKGSIILLSLGNFVVFSSSAAAVMIIGLIISTLGMGFAPIMRSLVTVLVESHHESETSDIGRLYALISVMEGIGSLVAGPGMAWTFQLGISWGYAWLGLPFGFAGFLFTLVSIVIFSVKI